MKINTIEKGKRILRSIEAEHHADKNKIATGDLKTPTELVKNDLNIILKNLEKKSTAEAKKIVFADHACGFGTSLLVVKEKLMQMGIDEKYVVEKQLLGMDIDKDKVLTSRLVIDPEKSYNINKNIVVGNSTSMTFETRGITHSWNNEPYLGGDKGRTPIYPDIINNVDKQNPIQQSETHLLPRGICLSSHLSHILKNFFEKGLEHCREWNMDKFHGAKVRTNSYICNRGYEGPIKIWEDGKYLFEYDFKNLGYIVNGGSLELTKFLIEIRNKNFDNPMYINRTQKKFWEEYDKVKDNKFKNSIPVLKVNRTGGIKKEDIGYISNSKYDSYDINKWKAIIGYQPTGSNYGQSLGNISLLEPGILVPQKYVWQSFDSEEETMNRINYLTSPIMDNWIMKKTRTQPTLDASKPRNEKDKKNFNQLKFVDVIDPKINIENSKDILEIWKKKYGLSNSIIKELLNEIG